MVNKNLLTSFISKYYLNGKFNSVKWRVNDNKLVVYAGESGRTCKVELNKFDLEDCELGIFDTNKLNKLISITSGELLITTDSLGALSNKLSIADLGFDVIYSLCDPLIIPKIKMYNDPEVWEMELELSPDDISNLIKAKNALSDYNYFTINASKDADGILLSEFTFGDGNNYSNKIQYKIQGRIDDELLNDPIPFDSEIFKNILNSNKDMIKSSFKLSKKGMLKLEFESEDLTSIYYVARNEQQN
tara:strand:+ start:81 stop:818 length:738 start_codon:yes stop_codon:yes gene_type:complete